MKKRNDKIIKWCDNLMRLLALAFAFGTMLSVHAAAVFETLNNATDEAKVFTFGSPVEAGEIQTNNIGSASSCANGRFAFRAGTVNVREGGYVRANGNGTASADKLLGNWLGANAGIATLNIEGGTFWMDVSGASNDGAGVLRVPVNGGSNDAILNLSSGVLRVDKYLHIGGTLYNSTAACAKNGVVNISGGTAKIATLNLGASSNKGGSSYGGGYANATLNLTGGTLEVAKFNFTAGHSQFFTWGGGTVKATAANVFSSATLANGCARTVNVTGNPAVFDTGNFAQTIPACIANGTGTLKLTGGNTVTLSAAPSFSLWLDGTTLAPVGGALSVPASGTFTFSGSATVSGSLTLGSGSSIVCNVDAVNPGYSATLTASEGFSIPEGAGSVLALLTVSGAGAADCEASLSADGKTITVLKSGDPNYVWNGGAAANWGDTDVWSNNNAAATWVDGYNAVFNTANATATLDSDVTALSLAFNVPATVCGSSVLTVPTVSVVSDVTATISAPTAGPLAKTGAGVLTLGSSRSATTTLSEGTLTMSGIGTTLDWSGFTFGTDPSKPVTLRFADGATLNGDPSPMYAGEVAHVTSTLVKECGDWTLSGNFALGRADGVNATFLHKGGTMTVGEYFVIGSTGTDYAKLVICGGTVNSTSTRDYARIAAKADATVVVTNGAAFKVAGDLVLSHQEGDGVLDIADGTVDVGGKVVFGVSPDAGNGTVNLGSGGMLTASQIYRSNSPVAVFNFNGGTLKAGATGTLIAASDNLAVTVGPLGGTIDNDGKNVTIVPTISGTAGLTLVGSGTTTISSDQEYLGETIVSSGTTLSVAGITFAGGVVFEADSSLNIASYTMGTPSLTASTLTLPAEGTVSLTLNGGDFTLGRYAILEKSGITVQDVQDKLVPSAGVWEVSGNTLYLVVKGENDILWVGGTSTDLSNGANWLGGSVPSSTQNAVISAPADTVLTCSVDFSPASITFPAGCPALTIGGENDAGEITGITSITNLSSNSHVINVPVRFAGDIQVKQAAMAEVSDLTKAHVTFAGGAYAAQDYSLENGDSSAVYSRCIFGKYYLASTAGNPWTARVSGSNNRICLADNSSLYVPYAGRTTELYIGNGSKVDIGEMVSDGGRVSWRNCGQMVVTNLTLSGTGDRFATYHQTLSTSVPPIFKFERIETAMTANSFYFCDGSSASKGVYYIGSGGLNFSSASATGAYRIGRDASNDAQTLRPWYSDFTIADRGNGNMSLVINRDVTFCTDDEGGTGRTITVDAIVQGHKSPTITVSGSGTLKVNNTCKNNEQPPVTVTNTATLAIKPGASLGTGATTVNSGATLAVAESGTVTLGGNLTLKAGAKLGFNFTNRKVAPVLACTKAPTFMNGESTHIIVKVSGVARPSAGAYVLTSCGGFNSEGVSVTLSADAPKWAKSDLLSVNADGNLVLNVKPVGTLLIVR